MTSGGKGIEQAMQNLVDYMESPVAKRWGDLQVKVSALEHDLKHNRNADRFVVATDDGRTIEARNCSLLLDIGDSPKALTQEEAAKLARHWNSSSRKAIDRVSVMSWNVHAVNQIERIKARQDAAEFVAKNSPE